MKVVGSVGVNNIVLVVNEISKINKKLFSIGILGKVV